MSFYGDKAKKINDPFDSNRTMIAKFLRENGYVNGTDSFIQLEKIIDKFFPDISSEYYSDFNDFINGYNANEYIKKIGDASNCNDIIVDYDKLNGDHGKLNYNYKVAENVINVLRNVKISDMNDEQKKSLDWAIDFRNKYFDSIDYEVKDVIKNDVWWKPFQFYSDYNVGYDMASAYARFLKYRRIEDAEYTAAMQVINKIDNIPSDLRSSNNNEELEDAHEYCRFYFYINIPNDARSLIEQETLKRIEDRNYYTDDFLKFNIDREMLSKYAKYCEYNYNNSNNASMDKVNVSKRQV